MRKHINSAFTSNLLRKRYNGPSQIAGPNTIYFLQGDITGMIKIAYCRNLQASIKTAKMYCSEDLTLIGKTSGTINECNKLHSQFSHLRAHDDWFHSDIELIEFAKSFERWK